MRKINWIILHCTAGPQDQKPETILDYWKRVLGWETPGYHYLIEADGTIHNLHPIEKPSNGVKGFNANSIHIAYIGGVVTASTATPEMSKGMPIDNRTHEQKMAMEGLVEHLSERFPNAVIQGHRDFSPDKNRNGIIEPSEWVKACPSFSTKDWLKQIGFKSKLPPVILQTTTTRVNIREGAGTNFKMVAPTLAKGTKVKKLAEVPGWNYVKIEGTTVVGWVANQYLK